MNPSEYHRQIITDLKKTQNITFICFIIPSKYEFYFNLTLKWHYFITISYFTLYNIILVQMFIQYVGYFNQNTSNQCFNLTQHVICKEHVSGKNRLIASYMTWALSLESTDQGNIMRGLHLRITDLYKYFDVASK